MRHEQTRIEFQQARISAHVTAGKGISRQAIELAILQITQGGAGQTQVGGYLIGGKADSLTLVTQQCAGVNPSGIFSAGYCSHFVGHQDCSDSSRARASGLAGYSRRSCNA